MYIIAQYPSIVQIQVCILLYKLNDLTVFTFSATKTDLRLLLECLKYQMKWPGSQKQALLTIISICNQNGLIYSSEHTHMMQKYDLPQINLKIFDLHDIFDFL